ncbi:hypothetical protein [Novosphingobium sp. 9]|uniref:hypothetical protein n=1 Tax=Novosphingobium sp. 9 TaxID=2025349 RepID=UPI0021B50A28|nr:hypothetical protein [Novosphingobium sp. 9]
MKLVYLYEDLIRWLVSLCPAPDKFAQTYAGLAIWLGAALLMKKPLRHWHPLGVVIVAECLNECIDYLAHGGWMWRDTRADMIATWFWPVVIFAAIRVRPKLRG